MPGRRATTNSADSGWTFRLYQSGRRAKFRMHSNDRRDDPGGDHRQHRRALAARIRGMIPGAPPLTEAEYWRDYAIICDDVNAAMVSCYTHRTLNHLVANDESVYAKVNRSSEYWRITSFSLQATLFIVLARILDQDDKVHSVHQLL